MLKYRVWGIPPAHDMHVTLSCDHCTDTPDLTWTVSTPGVTNGVLKKWVSARGWWVGPETAEKSGLAWCPACLDAQKYHRPRRMNRYGT
jgi:hypothetical protein